MVRTTVKVLCLLVIICATAGATDNAELQPLKEPDCLPVELLVELPISQQSFYQLSETHTFVRRCIGINDEKKACVSKDPEVKMEDWSVVKVTGSAKKETIRVSWVSHETCGYQRRRSTNCKIEEARECHEKSATHYYDEINCVCACLVQIDGEDTCFVQTARRASHAETTVIWLPILTFILGVVACGAFLYFKTLRDGQNMHLGLNNGMHNTHNESSHPVIGFTDVEQPAEPPTPPAAIDESAQEKIGFIH
ncbi:unnamed protein product [Meganyctiphanes norvegica]|uniref:Uncharacterized protein n=1 Tax=Meganyctiphanes norvegica TaxID=48144 RepID=A0AAV2SFI9_MEGNR